MKTELLEELSLTDLNHCIVYSEVMVGKTFGDAKKGWLYFKKVLKSEIDERMVFLFDEINETKK